MIASSLTSPVGNKSKMSLSTNLYQRKKTKKKTRKPCSISWNARPKSKLNTTSPSVKRKLLTKPMDKISHHNNSSTFKSSTFPKYKSLLISIASVISWLSFISLPKESNLRPASFHALFQSKIRKMIESSFLKRGLLKSLNFISWWLTSSGKNNKFTWKSGRRHYKKPSISPWSTATRSSSVAYCAMPLKIISNSPTRSAFFKRNRKSVPSKQSKSWTTKPFAWTSPKSNCPSTSIRLNIC